MVVSSRLAFTTNSPAGRACTTSSPVGRPLQQTALQLGPLRLTALWVGPLQQAAVQVGPLHNVTLCSVFYLLGPFLSQQGKSPFEAGLWKSPVRSSRCPAGAALTYCFFIPGPGVHTYTAHHVLVLGYSQGVWAAFWQRLIQCNILLELSVRTSHMNTSLWASVWLILDVEWDQECCVE